MLSQTQRPPPLSLTTQRPTPVYPRRGSIDGNSPLNIVRPGFPRPPVSAPAMDTAFGHARTQSYPGDRPVTPPSSNRTMTKAAFLDAPTRQRRISAPSSPKSAVKAKAWQKADSIHLHPNGSTSSLNAHAPRQTSPLTFNPELYNGNVPVTLLGNKTLPKTSSQASLSPLSSSSSSDLKLSKSHVDLSRIDSSSTESSKSSSSSNKFGGFKNYAKSLFRGDDVVRKRSDSSAATPNTLLLNCYYNGDNLPPALNTPSETLSNPRRRPAKGCQTLGNRRSIFTLHS